MRIGIALAALIAMALSLLIANVPWSFEGSLRGTLPKATDLLMMGAQALAIVFGICFASFHYRLSTLVEQGVQSIVVGTELKMLTASTRFWLALSVAPIIFCVIVKLTDEMSGVAALIVAFQNGFFWEKVLPHARQATVAGLTRERGKTTPRK